MILYILRHEDRTQDCSFFSPLTELGLRNANNLIKILEKENIININDISNINCSNDSSDDENNDKCDFID